MIAIFITIMMLAAYAYLLAWPWSPGEREEFGDGAWIIWVMSAVAYGSVIAGIGYLVKAWRDPKSTESQ